MLINRIKLAKMLLKLAAISTDKAELIYEGDLVEGVEVFVEKDGEIVAAEDGEYVTEDKIIIVSEGKVTEIREKVVEPIEPNEMLEEIERELVVEEPKDDERVKELEDKVAELEKLLGEKDDKIAELEDELTKRNDELDALKMSSELPAKEAAKTAKEGALRFF